ARSLAGLAPYEIRVNHRVEIALEYTFDVAHRELAPQILRQPVRCEHIIPDLAAEIDIELGILGLARLLALPLELALVEARAKLLHGAIAILVLRALILALNDNSRRIMHDPHRRIGHIHVLAARAARAERIDAQIFLPYVDLDFVVDLR